MISTPIRLAAAAATAVFALPALAAGPLTSPAELAAMIEAGNVAVIDIRGPVGGSGPEEFAAGHIPGAAYEMYAPSSAWMVKRNGVVGMLPEPEALEATIRALGVDAGEPVVIVSSGKPGKALSVAAATRVYWTFKALGHDAVSILDGGHAAWVAAGLPVTAEAAAPAPGDFTAALRPEMIADASDVADSMSTPVALVDARGPAMFTGAVVSGKVSRGGAIPGAVNVPYTAMMTEDQTRYLPAAEIQAALAAAGVTPGTDAIVYCNIGLSGAAGWFGVSEVAGEDGAVLYDGSAADWTIDPSRPTLITGEAKG
jgi:thiosulfate/3-mercaptopyruvate sulfurtransferase